MILGRWVIAEGSYIKYLMRKSIYSEEIRGKQGATKLLVTMGIRMRLYSYCLENIA